MPQYFLIEVPVYLQASQSEILSVKISKGKAVEADFVLPSNPSLLLRLTLGNVEVLRLLDEMALSTEADSQPIGLVPDNLAYEVIGSSFWKQQSEALRIMKPNLRHFRFITGWTCMDLLTEDIPIFTVVAC